MFGKTHGVGLRYGYLILRIHEMEIGRSDSIAPSCDRGLAGCPSPSGITISFAAAADAPCWCCSPAHHTCLQHSSPQSLPFLGYFISGAQQSFLPEFLTRPSLIGLHGLGAGASAPKRDARFSSLLSSNSASGRELSGSRGGQHSV